MLEGQPLHPLKHALQILFASRFNNKLTQFVSPVPDPLAWAVKSSADKEQGFSEAVAARIEAP